MLSETDKRVTLTYPDGVTRKIFNETVACRDVSAREGKSCH